MNFIPQLSQDSFILNFEENIFIFEQFGHLPNAALEIYCPKRIILLTILNILIIIIDKFYM